MTTHPLSGAWRGWTTLAALALIPGCTLFGSAVEGTWLFLFDRNADVSGDCDTGSNVEYIGDQPMWVDIYGTGGGGTVVLLGEPLVGEFKGAKLTGAYEDAITKLDLTQSSTVELSATLEGGMLQGSVVSSLVLSGVTEYSCVSEQEFLAERNVSDPDRYLE